jgi:NAD(P)-dependent dehydrogenase (short-subunit alcohol dehydrogenase family)
MANSKDVVVTGVSNGIGWGTTKVLVSKGLRCLALVRKQTDADRLQACYRCASQAETRHCK